MSLREIARINPWGVTRSGAADMCASSTCRTQLTNTRSHPGKTMQFGSQLISAHRLDVKFQIGSIDLVTGFKEGAQLARSHRQRTRLVIGILQGHLHTTEP